MLLDCIRGVAILSVLVYHVAREYDYAALDEIGRVAWRYGLLGVDIFFPLSGFLISRYLLHASESRAIKVFFQRRLFRIVPLYFTAVSIFLLLSMVLGFESANIGRIWITYLFLTGWFIFFEGGPAHVPYTITWSLSVEEFAYILFGLCAWWSRRAFVSFLVFSSIGALALRFYLNLNGFEGVYNFPLARLDSIAMGGLVAVALDRRTRRLASVLGLSTIATYLVALGAPALWSSLKYTFITLGTCYLIVLFDTRFHDARSRLLGWLSSIGFYSYFTYLFHLFNIHLLLLVAKRFYPGGVAPFWPVVLVALAMTQTQAVLSYRFFEGPLMRYGRRLEARDRQEAVKAEAA
jgi:peptidoglycan/LPS O-acetylase OafA/YrhL